ncbi:hypothetical protein BCR35DRAFT_265499 [Leucosporidium creatinivorum]|uniref:RRM domain-containing protein n=1 Tax=Leucosporidium creatinivorum TaxID=106004 RepID=A0A1Y2FG51_9BASI|nr:hypothetical protein BCR35DRAFT_265499 [Leucosporidium creatinivorum]
MSLDQSLDDIVAAKKAGSRNNQRRRGPSNRGGAAAKGGEAPVQQQQQKGGRQPRQQQQQQQGAASQLPALGGVVGDKVIVSNLPDDVNEAQVRELFTTTVGPTSSVFLAYNSKQKSTGVATVTFRKAADATKAYREYNGRLIDGSGSLLSSLSLPFFAVRRLAYSVGRKSAFAALAFSSAQPGNAQCVLSTSSRLARRRWNSSTQQTRSTTSRISRRQTAGSPDAQPNGGSTKEERPTASLR